MWDHLGAVATLVLVAFNIATAIVMVLLKISLGDMRIELAATQAALTAAISSSRKEIDERVELQGRQFGETVSAIRAKIVEVELYCRDNFVRRDSFYKVSEDMTRSVQTFFDKIEKRLEFTDDKIDKRLERMEKKIDSKT